MKNETEAIPPLLVIHIPMDEHLTEVNAQWPRIIGVVIEGKEYITTAYHQGA